MEHNESLFEMGDCRGAVVSLRQPRADELVRVCPTCFDADADDVLSHGCVCDDDQQGELLYVAPAWFVDMPDCPGDQACDCGVSSLTEVLERLRPEDRSLAAAAHLKLLRHLTVHVYAAGGVLAGLSDLGAGTCVGCLLNPIEHMEELQDALGEASRDLAAAMVAFDVSLLVGEARSTASPNP